MKGRVDCVDCGPVPTVCKLKRIYSDRNGLLDIRHDFPLKALHHNWGECNRVIAI